jgi:ZIP family zinc transporter
VWPAQWAIVVGSVVDGVPESLIFGNLQGRDGLPDQPELHGGLSSSPTSPRSIALPQPISRPAGWTARRVGVLWFWIVLACGVAAALASCSPTCRPTSKAAELQRSPRAGSSRC